MNFWWHICPDFRILKQGNTHRSLSQETTTNDLRLRRISIPDFIHYIFLLIFILQKEPVFHFLMLSAKQGNYWYHFYKSLVWRGPWLGIEPGTSRTRSQHYTTRLSRRRYLSALSLKKPNTYCTQFLVFTDVWYSKTSLNNSMVALNISTPSTYTYLSWTSGNVIDWGENIKLNMRIITREVITWLHLAFG